MKNVVVMDQPILLHKPNKKVFIPQTKYTIIYYIRQVPVWSSIPPPPPCVRRDSAPFYDCIPSSRVRVSDK